MHDEDPIDELKADWRGQSVQIHELQRRLRRWRPIGYLIMGAELMWTLLGLVAGVVFAFVAWNTRDFLFGLSALVILAACVAISIPLFHARRRSLRWADQTPEGTLVYALSRTREIDKILNFEFWSGVVLLCFAAIVWICVLAGLVPRGYPLVLMSSVWIAGAGAVILWAKLRRRRNARERLSCETLLAAFRSANEIDSS